MIPPNKQYVILNYRLFVQYIQTYNKQNKSGKDAPFKLLVFIKTLVCKIIIYFFNFIIPLYNFQKK
jgi:hypothetical protein